MWRLLRTLRLHGSACCQLCRLRAAPRSRQLPIPSLRQAHLPRWLSDAFVACRRLHSSLRTLICTISDTYNHDFIASLQAHTGPGFAGRTAHRFSLTQCSELELHQDNFLMAGMLPCRCPEPECLRLPAAWHRSSCTHTWTLQAAGTPSGA